MFDFAGVSWFPVLFAGTSLGFFAHHGDPRAIHRDVEEGNARSQRNRQVQLQGLLQLALLPGFDIGADGFSGALHRLGRDG